MADLYTVRKALSPMIAENRRKLDASELYASLTQVGEDDLEDLVPSWTRPTRVTDAIDQIIDMKEFDVPFHVRVAIDKRRSTAMHYKFWLTILNKKFELANGTLSVSNMA
jgi:DNA polymerase epsilon subunit 1